MYTNDILWKSILEDTFEDFLLFFFPDSNAFFDFSRGFEYLDKELEQLFPPDGCAHEVKFVDKLVKVYLLDGQEEWILVHVEVQGYVDKTFSERMFTYYYRIWDNYRRRITAFAILTDENAAFLPSKFEQNFLGTRLSFEFNSYKVLDQSEDYLLKSTNPFAHVVLVVKLAMRGKTLQKEDLFSLKMALARRLLAMQIPKRKIGKLMKFLKLYVKFNDENFEEKFEKEISNITINTHKTMGIDELYLQIRNQEAREKGLAEGRKVGREVGLAEGEHLAKMKLVQNLLRETSFDLITIARLADVPLEFVEQVRSEY
ncbi:hypothetical protein [Dyadobacter sp. CY343]|uniref:hypothetical protein n=1 Tax=Dyadobacter sp. CY343 TaxID=2907299 RepID=UPI001F37D5C5|nr:hypothetical protein [Dyadobacter sp. CY343]MCE7058723.1 hypothetical protein [Dyadobacter sp. CY343]